MKKYRIGIINLMPDVVDYHFEFLDAVALFSEKVEVCWISLDSKAYNENSKIFIGKNYKNFSYAYQSGEIDALIISGAPVEHLNFTDVVYWMELKDIINFSIEKGIPLLGICWGALAVGRQLGLRKVAVKKKISGVLNLKITKDSRVFFKLNEQNLCMPFSTTAKFCVKAVEKKARRGCLKVVAVSGALHSILQTSDNKVMLCLGHPEYKRKRLIKEWVRDGSLREQHLRTLPGPCDISRNAKIFFDYWMNISFPRVKAST